MAIPSVCLSVCPSHGWISQKWLKFSPYSNPIPLVFWGKFHPDIQAGASNKGGVGKISHFLPLSVNISKTVPDTAKVTINE